MVASCMYFWLNCMCAETSQFVPACDFNQNMVKWLRIRIETGNVVHSILEKWENVIVQCPFPLKTIKINAENPEWISHFSIFMANQNMHIIWKSMFLWNE